MYTVNVATDQTVDGNRVYDTYAVEGTVITPAVVADVIGDDTFSVRIDAVFTDTAGTAVYVTVRD